MKVSPKCALTDLQRKVIFVGCTETARYLGEDPERYRKRIMLEELKIASLSECNRTADFDKLMQRVWVDRGDYARALAYVGGDIKRLAYLATESAKTILIQKGADPNDPKLLVYALKYIATVMINMHMAHTTVDLLALKLQCSSGWDDFSPIRLKSVVSSLQVHVRRKS